MDLVEVVSAHGERAVARVGGLYVKVETVPERAAAERLALATVPVPVPRVVWEHDGPPAVLAIESVTGAPLGELGTPSPHAPAVWSAVGEVVRSLHEWSPPPGAEPSLPFGDITPWIDELRAWFRRATDVDATVVDRHAAVVVSVLDGRTAPPVFVHGDLQPAHVFVDGGRVSGVIDWGDAGLGDPLHDLAVLTVGHPERLDDVLAGYGGATDLDVEAIRAYGTARRLGAVRWMIEHGYDPAGDIAALHRLGD